MIPYPLAIPSPVAAQLAMRPGALILRHLRSAGLDFTPVDELSQAAGIPRPDVLRELGELESAGFELEHPPGTGCRLLRRPAALIAEDIEASLGQGPIEWRVQVFRETASTNDIVDDAGRAGAAEGLAVFAESQTRGRGRLGRRWESRPGRGIWFSALLRPPWRASEAGRLTAVAAVAVAESIAALTELPTTIKWPNDVWVNGRKLAGILTELRCTGDGIDYAVVGIGINAHHQPNDFPPELRATATSIAMESGQSPHRADIAAAALDRLAECCHGPFGPIRERWISRCFTLGRTVELSGGSAPLRGVAESIDAGGALIVRDGSGRLRTIHDGDVIHGVES